MFSFAKGTNRGKVAVAAVALIGALALVGCSGQPLTTREKGTLGGGVLGAGTGAIIGAAVGAPGAGAAIGGALGAGTGYVIGNALQNQEVAVGRYQAGVGTVLDLLTAQTAAASAQQTRITAEYNWEVSRARLVLALGRLTSAEPLRGSSVP